LISLAPFPGIDEGIRLQGRGDSFLQTRISQKSLCPICRGTKKLCGKPICPVTLQYYTFMRLERFQNVENIYGNSPPSIFVGSYNYPKVNIGPMVPPVTGDTSIYDFPERWLDKSLEEILNFRSSLIHGSFRVDVKRPWDAGRNYDKLVDMILSYTPPEVEASFTKKPRKIITVSEDITLFGPTAPLKSMRIGSLKTDFKVEKYYYDTDIKASEAVIELYREGVPISKIQRVFSAAVLGLKKLRRVVPTRWSITAVDDIVSLHLLEKVKRNPWIDSFLVYHHKVFDNIYVVLLIPSNWSYEWLEAWFPKTFWNRFSKEPVIYADHEHYRGRTTYSDVGGCYYSTRLAVAEKLHGMGRQGAAIVFREVHEGYLFPLGVWNVREGVRATLSKPPERFDTLEEALQYAVSKLTIPLRDWVQASSYLHELLRQRRITDYVPLTRYPDDQV